MISGLILAGIFVLGVLVGAALGVAGFWWKKRTVDVAMSRLEASTEAMTQHVLALANDKLGQHAQVVTGELTAKQGLIDQRLATIGTQMAERLAKVETLVTTLEKDRENKFAALSATLGQTGQQLTALQHTTTDLKAALSNSRTRGQWGERMAEDVLRLAGMQLGVNYRKQSVLTGPDGNRPRPDLTFLLPGGQVVHMDVKFPLDHYLQYLQAETDDGRASAVAKFLSATRAHIKTTAARDYRLAATAQGETALDYLLIFIPNEQVYAFLMEQSPDLAMDATRDAKVILCSPTTLLAVLAVIHQAMANFTFERRAGEVQAVLAGIKEQWDKFADVMDKMGRALGTAQSAFTDMTTTRARALDRQFDRLGALDAHGADEPPLRKIG